LVYRRDGCLADGKGIPASDAATPPARPDTLPSATAHPAQVEAPKGNEDQGHGTDAQQQYDRFQHARITPAGLAKACALAAKLSSFRYERRPAETIFPNDENVLKQSAAYLVGNKTGTVVMQIIFDFIWNQSRNRFLATIGEQEVER
jgi:hypothetical protein